MTDTAYRDKNDAIRTSGNFGPDTENPLIVTSGVRALGNDAIAMIYLDVMTFTDFSEEFDPQDHHDMGAVTYEGTEIWFKIDPTDSPDRRTFTFFLPEEH